MSSVVWLVTLVRVLTVVCVSDSPTLQYCMLPQVLVAAAHVVVTQGCSIGTFDITLALAVHACTSASM
jgi:hypothetical protein